jgi:hypothetical protein
MREGGRRQETGRMRSMAISRSVGVLVVRKWEVGCMCAELVSMYSVCDGRVQVWLQVGDAGCGEVVN